MKLRKIIAAAVSAALLTGHSALTAFAAKGVQPLQAYFTDEGRTINIFASEPIVPDASLLVGSERLPAEVVTSEVRINTVFLVENSAAMPYELRDEIKAAIREYASAMPESESVKIAAFDSRTTYLADDFSRDTEYISAQLAQINFDGSSCFVYDAVLDAAECVDTSAGAYCRTVLISDGVGSAGDTSFDHLRSVISENGRSHVDVVQVSADSVRDDDLTVLGKLGSNTYTLFETGTRLNDLRPETVSMIRVSLTNNAANGDLKGVTVKNGGSNIPLGTILFPDVEIEDPTVPATTADAAEAPAEEKPAAQVTAAAEPASAEKGAVMDGETADDGSSGFSATVPVIIGAAVLAAVIAAALVLIRGKKDPKCSIMVNIQKDDERDMNGVGMDVWRFRASSEFRVGRTLSPKGNDNTPLPKNDKAICETATNEDISSIGRNAFALTYDKRAKRVMIRNIAQGAVFTVETDGRSVELRSGQTDTVTKGTKILLGSYTTVIIHNINVS